MNIVSVARVAERQRRERSQRSRGARLRRAGLNDSQITDGSDQWHALGNKQFDHSVTSSIVSLEPSMALRHQPQVGVIEPQKIQIKITNEPDSPEKTAKAPGKIKPMTELPEFKQEGPPDAAELPKVD